MKYKSPENFKILCTTLAAWRAKKDAAKAASSAERKAHTVAKREIGAFLREEGLPPSTALKVPDGEYSYGVAESDRINPREWHALFVTKQITEEQYFGAISVTKDTAKDAIGADQVETISARMAGTEASVRFKKSDAISTDAPELVEKLPQRRAALRPVVLPSGRNTVQPSANGLRKLSLRKLPK